MTQQQLWTTDRIEDWANDAFDSSDYIEVVGAMKLIRGDYEKALAIRDERIVFLEAEIEQLTQALAAQAAEHEKALARINELERRECIAALNRIAELEAAEKNWEKAVADLTQTSLDLIDDNDELQAQLAAQAAEHAAALYELDTYRKSLDIMSGRIVQLEEEQAEHAAALDSIKNDAGLCAAAVVLAWHRKTHDHILADDDTINAAWRVEKWLGRR